MQVIEIRGIQDLIKLGLGFLMFLALSVALPSLFMLVLWNAVVFEGLMGPEIHFGQAVLLWMIMAVAFKLVFNPEIHVEFQAVSDPKDIEKLNQKK